ncbi:MAG: hypothetical protein AMXMBFR84_09530 [Candidatus Hydrogenedentota bacterium]
MPIMPVAAAYNPWIIPSTSILIAFRRHSRGPAGAFRCGDEGCHTGKPGQPLTKNLYGSGEWL